jgi:hypothetical protein
MNVAPFPQYKQKIALIQYNEQTQVQNFSSKAMTKVSTNIQRLKKQVLLYNKFMKQ